ncbi:unnamed protein product [Paramecium octaurelia]|uniref:PARP1-like PADR1 domain-containing protein n=1 Tax=Paramecium octaurelia TaxID=43137 RepID=A0A8S1TVI4_PAROT|nr:unnamed protein product [Paramecium octaurelia]
MARQSAKTKKAVSKTVSKAVKKQVVKKATKVIQKKVPKKIVKKETKKVVPAKKKVVSRKPQKNIVVKAAPVKKVVPKKAKAVAPAKKQVSKKQNVKEQKDDKKKVLKPVAPKADAQPKVPVKFAAYTLDQYQAYQKAIKDWSSKTNQEIKDNLRKNLQSMSGNKDELLNKIADGIVLGSIPRCPHCYGGRPKYNQSTGTYFCVGYRDDTDFKFCNKTIASLDRTPWEL